MTDTTVAPEAAESTHKLSDKTLRRVFWRSCMLDSPWDYERQQHIGYSYAIKPALDEIYADQPEKKKRAYARSLDFMAVTPQLSTLLMGINAAMEEENAASDDFDESVIPAVKTSLMGPLAGIGDSLIAGTMRVVATGIAIGFAQQGSILGPLLLLLVFNIPAFIIRWFGMKFGYKFGSAVITDAEKSGVMEKVTFVASVVGLMAIGAMIASYIWLDLPIMIGSGDFAQPLTDYFDMIMPCMIQMILFGLMYWLLGRKGIKTTWILVGTILICIVFAFVMSMFGM